MKIPVIVDNGKYETPGFLTKILRIPIIIVLNLLPKKPSPESLPFPMRTKWK